MKKVVKWSLLIIALVLVVIQFFRPEKNISSAAADQDIAKHYGVPNKVLAVLQRSCYDCHSNNTAYPWYNNIQPFAWFLADHVKEGKDELNFSTFASYTPKKAAHKLDEVIGETNEGEMPLSSYTLVHRNAILSDQEVKMINEWATTLGDSIRNANGLAKQ
jgi:hypothetical protein